MSDTDRITALEAEVLGLKVELRVVIQYLSTTNPKDNQPILGPTRWDAFQQDIRKGLDKAVL